MTTRFDDDSYNRYFDKNYVTPTRDYYPEEEKDEEEKYIPSPKDVEDIALVDDESFFKKTFDSFTKWMNSQVFVKK